MFRKRALTFIETIVALALLAVFAIITFPELASYQKMAKKMELNTRMRFAMQEEIEREKAGLDFSNQADSGGWKFLFDRQESIHHGMREMKLTIREETSGVEKTVYFLIP